MKKQTIQGVFIFAHFCLMMMFLGGAVFETFINYPNWFYDIPASLENANRFLHVRNPGHFFQVLFPLMILTGIGFVIIGWKVKPARTLILLSLVSLIAIEALTVVYIYPRIGIMLRQGAAAHSIEFLKQTAQEFLRANQIRLVFISLAEMLSSIGMWKFFQHKSELRAS